MIAIVYIRSGAALPVTYSVREEPLRALSLMSKTKSVCINKIETAKYQANYFVGLNILYISVSPVHLLSFCVSVSGQLQITTAKIQQFFGITAQISEIFL